MTVDGGSERLVAIQVLRAAAALAVVTTHFQVFLGRATGGATGLPDLSAGRAGVDLFFVISGFVMVYSSERLFAKPNAAATFATHRLIRIVPLYWAVTTIYLLIGLAAPGMGKIYPASYVAASYVFIPMARPDGEIAPLVSQGWTLNYEMLFYALFACTLLFSRRVAVTLATIVIIALVASGYTFHPASEALKFWTDNIMLEFAFGMILGALFREGIRLPAWAAVGCIAAGLALFLAGPDWPRACHYGLSFTLIVLGAAFGGFSWRSPLWRGAELLGDASYALYLVHLLPILLVLFVARHAGVPLVGGAWFLLAATLIVAAALSIVVHLTFERPVTRLLRKMTASSRITPALDNGMALP